MTTTPIQRQLCPTCGFEFTKVISACRKARERDLAVCMSCSDILVFEEGMVVRQALLDDLLYLTQEQHKHIEEMQTLVRTTRPVQKQQREGI